MNRKQEAVLSSSSLGRNANSIRRGTSPENADDCVLGKGVNAIRILAPTVRAVALIKDEHTSR